MAHEERNIVLVHGAWFGAWVWTPVAKRLRALGHNVFAPTLTGQGEKRHLLRPGINLDTHAEDVVRVIELEDLHEVVLVGWSYGGMVISDVLARVKPRIASMVYLDAFVPERGMCQMDYPNRIGGVPAFARLAANGQDVPPMPASTWFSDPAEAAYVDARVGPHPVLTMLQPSKALEVLPTGEIAHIFVLAGGEWAPKAPTLVPFKEKMAADPNVEAQVWEVGHAMMWTHPQRTAEYLASVR